MKRLLLVDDNIEFLELLSGVLNGHFHFLLQNTFPMRHGVCP